MLATSLNTSFLIKIKDFLKVSSSFFMIVLTFFLIEISQHAALISAFAIVYLFLVNRSKEILHPTNVVFGYYCLYVVMPCFLFYIFEIFDWEYLLPWGKLNDWSTLSPSTVSFYFSTYVLFYYFLKLLCRSENEFVVKKRFQDIYVNINIVYCMLIISFGVGVIFMNATGGLDLWVNDYKYTYLERKAGYGWINLILLHLSNLAVFFCGLVYFSSRSPRGLKRLIFILVVSFVILYVSYLQGIKSRLVYFAVLFFFPFLFSRSLSLTKGFIFFLCFLLFFMLSMYFRSDGFYSSFSKNLEYLLSYFNTYMLHDMVIRDYDPDMFRTLSFSFSKIFSAIGFESDAKYHDISYWLTDTYFPEQWARSTTQQWPIETELYFNFYGYAFYIIPIFLYSLFIAALYNSSLKGMAPLYFIFISELFRFFIMFRGGMLPWNMSIFFGFYVFAYFFAMTFIRYRPSR